MQYIRSKPSIRTPFASNYAKPNRITERSNPQTWARSKSSTFLPVRLTFFKAIILSNKYINLMGFSTARLHPVGHLSSFSTFFFGIHIPARQRTHTHAQPGTGRRGAESNSRNSLVYDRMIHFYLYLIALDRGLRVRGRGNCVPGVSPNVVCLRIWSLFSFSVQANFCFHRVMALLVVATWLGK